MTLPERLPQNLSQHPVPGGFNPSLLHRLVRQPLLHFIVAGFALFLIYGGLNDTHESQSRIEVTTDDIRRIEVSWLARWQRPPTEAELRRMIEEHIREEVLYREALALGLEKNDTIIRRRLAQKMDFLAEDVATLREPAPGELEAWFASDRQRFASPPLATFRHLFFAADKRGTDAEADARNALRTLAGSSASGGDAFMFQNAYAEQTPDQVVRVFGAKFAGRLFQEQPGGWRGPIESGYGWHLVWIDTLMPAELPAFETVARQAKVEWLSEQRNETKRATFDALRARYEIVVADQVRANDRVAAVRATQ